MRQLVFASFGLFMLTGAHAAGLDCAKASTEVEHMICADGDLLELDEHLNGLYGVAMHDAGRAAAIRKSQKAWLRTRDACASPGCVKRAYEARIVEMRSIIAAGTCKTQETTTQDYGNHVSLAVERSQCGPDTGFTIRFTVVEKRPTGTRTLLVLSDYSVAARFMDIDGDNVPEIDFCDNFTAPNCGHHVYHYSPSAGTLRKVLDYSGTSIWKFDGYLVSDIHDGAAAFSAEAFKLLSAKELEVEPTPRFRVSTELLSDEDGNWRCECQFTNTRSAKPVPMDPPGKAWNHFCFPYDESLSPRQCKLTGKGGKTVMISR